MVTRSFQEGVLSGADHPFNPGGGSLGYSPFPGSALRSRRDQARPPVRRPSSLREQDRHGTSTFSLASRQTGRQAPLPPPPDVSDLFEDEGGAGGGGGGGGVAISAGMSFLDSARNRAAQALAALDDQFEQRRQMLSSEYRLAETPEEQATIQHLLDIIEVQREAGTKVIERVYGNAIEGAAARAAETRELGAAAAEQTRETFTSGADDAAEALGELNQRFGGAMGAGGEPLSPIAEAAVADMHRQAEFESAFDRRMFDVTADDIAFLGEAMRPEMGAQVGALQRTAAQTSALSQVDHDRRVQDRVAQERMQYQQALQQLAAMFDQRRFGLEDQQIGLDAQAAQLAASNARAGGGGGRGGGGGLSQLAQFELRRREKEHDVQLANAMRQREGLRQARSLQGLGVPGQTARFASELNLAEGLAGTILGSRFGQAAQAAAGAD